MTIEELISQDYRVIGSGRWGRTEEHNSLVIDRERDLFFWNSKNLYGNAYDWLTKVKLLSAQEAMKTLDNGVIPINQGISDRLFIRPEEELFSVYPELVKIAWENGQNNREYWYKRCLTDTTIDRFLLGYLDDWNVIPIFMDGAFRNFQCRKDEPKTIRPWYTGVGGLLFNSSILQLTTTVLITEGPVDAILLNQLGFPAMSHTSGNLGWDKGWIRYFTNQKEIYYIADHDEAGEKAAELVAKSLGIFRTRICRFTNYPEKYDTVDFFREGNSLDEFKQLLFRSEYLYE